MKILLKINFECCWDLKRNYEGCSIYFLKRLTDWQDNKMVKNINVYPYMMDHIDWNALKIFFCYNFKLEIAQKTITIKDLICTTLILMSLYYFTGSWKFKYNLRMNNWKTSLRSKSNEIFLNEWEWPTGRQTQEKAKENLITVS